MGTEYIRIAKVSFINQHIKVGYNHAFYASFSGEYQKRLDSLKALKIKL